MSIERHIHPFAPDGWLRLTTLEGDDELRLFGELPDALHRAEASCLAIAVAGDGWPPGGTTYKLVRV